MPEIFEVIEGWQGVMVKAGLGTPKSRALAAAAVGALVAYGLKMPSSSFRRDGSARPWKAVSFDPEATHKHFLMVPVTAAVVAYLFT